MLFGGEKKGVTKSWNDIEDETTLNAYSSGKKKKSRPTVYDFT